VRIAELELRRAGLELGATVRLPYGKAPEGTVLAQDPPAHAQDIERPTVNLLVAAPDDEGADGYVMPDLVGTSASGALATLARVGIKATTKAAEMSVGSVGTGNEPPRPPVPPGAIVAQMPPAGVRVDQSTAVQLMVAR
jgi:beta-lactam-binding protein with PASTA domain